MKKNLSAIIACIALSAAFFSCASSSGATDALTAAEKKERKTAVEFAAKQKTDPYTGWAYVPQKKVDISNGKVRIVLNGSAGTFNIYAKQDSGADTPLFSTVDASVSSYFSVKIGRQVYKLAKGGGVKSEARITPYGAQMAYTVSGKAYVVVDFSFLPSELDSPVVDMLRVSVYCINIGKTIQTFAVKSVFDTYLGETTKSHFSTANISSINSEMGFNSMETALWVRSKNDRAAVQLLLHGSEITQPELVVLANREQVSSSAWTPSVQEGRSFTSVLSFENSAVSVNWPAVYLDPLKSDIITFYVSLSNDDTPPAGREFLRELSAGRTALWSRPVISSASKTTPQSGNAGSTQAALSQTSADEDGFSLFIEDQYVEPVKVPQAAPKADSAPKADTAQSGTKSASYADPQLDPEYIQTIIDRIDELSKNPTAADEKEIASLNQELDEILVKLRGGR